MFIRSLLIGCFLFASASTCCADGIAGQLSPTVLQDLDGNRLTFGEISSGKPVYIKFWATWCGTCLKQMPHFQQATEKYKNDMDIISINIDINEDLQNIEKVKQEFSLSAPIFLDIAGELGQQLGFQGTPFHILLDKQGNIAYRGHKADETLNTALAEVATGAVRKMKDKSDADESEGQSLELFLDNKDVAVFFLAPWCDWYLEERRPKVRNNCMAGQRLTNALSVKYTGFVWRGISTRLWTEEKELNEYSEKYDVPYSLDIDKSNELFIKYTVKDFPTLIVFRNGKEEFRTSNFEDGDKIDAMLLGIVDAGASKEYNSINQ